MVTLRPATHKTPTGGEWTITLPFVPMSMNVRERAHWRKRKAEKDRILKELSVLCRWSKVPVAVSPRAVHVVVQKRGGHRDDPANLPSRAKSVLDALVQCKALVDDSDKWLTSFSIEETRGSTRCVHITISEQGEPPQCESSE